MCYINFQIEKTSIQLLSEYQHLWLPTPIISSLWVHFFTITLSKIISWLWALTTTPLVQHCIQVITSEQLQTEYVYRRSQFWRKQQSKLSRRNGGWRVAVTWNQLDPQSRSLAAVLCHANGLIQFFLVPQHSKHLQPVKIIVFTLHRSDIKIQPSELR